MSEKNENQNNMKQVTLGDKTFEVAIPESDILKSVKKCAEHISADYAGKNPICVVVLNGAFIFASDLLRMISVPCEVAFTKISSYEGTTSTQTIREHMPISEDISGRHVIIVEDIVESGYSMQFLTERLKAHTPASIEICALFHKPEQCKVPGLNIKYVGMKLPEAFIVGYGLDYDQKGRFLRDIYSLVSEK